MFSIERSLSRRWIAGGSKSCAKQARLGFFEPLIGLFGLLGQKRRWSASWRWGRLVPPQTSGPFQGGVSVSAFARLR